VSDRRELLANARVAHADLAGAVSAPRYEAGTWMRVHAPLAAIRRDPESDALERQMLRGEPFLVIEERAGHCFGKCGTSGYVGYVAADCLSRSAPPAHVVCAARTLVFARADLKTPDPLPLSLGSHLCVVGDAGRFSELDGGGFVPSGHMRPWAEHESDPVAVAERLLGTPYLWGGNSGFGIDCSGLVQIALNACGLFCPGDSDQQMRALGPSLPPGTLPRRGDLLFWKGHVAWCADAETLIHANAGAMAVAREDRKAAIARIAASGDGPVLAHIRPDPAPLQGP
jgi:hypothetical protein